MRKKIISCILALAMMFGVLQGTGVPVKADPGSTESNTITVNADCLGRQISDTDVSQRIIQTLDAMIEAGSENILLVTEDENFKTYLIGIDRSITSDLYDFMIDYDKTDKTVSVSCSQNWSVDKFESTLDCSAVGQEGCYSSITFYTYVFVYLMVNFETGTNTYFSKDIDGSIYTMDDDYYPTQSGEEPYIIPYKGTLEDIVGSEFVCFPEITREGKKYYSWHLVDEYTEPEDWEKVNINTSFTEFENALAVSFDEPAHNYPESTDTANDYVIWNWGTADNDYKDTYVEILCTDSDCPEEDKGVIRIQNTADITNLVNVTKEVVNTTCTIDGKTIYTATANHVENGTTYTYTATKTVDGENATGHNWVFDTLDTNAVWNDDNTTVTIKKTCTDTSHDTEEDGAVEVNVSSSNISNEVIAATKCGEASKTVYTATFDSSVDPAIETPFTITKTVMGDVLQHDWIFDTENAIWEGNDSDGYTKATITKKCKNTVHDGDNSITVSSTKIEKNVEPATEEDNTERTYYTAIFNSENDKDITNEFTVKKVVTKQVMPGCEFDVTSGVEWEKDVQGGYKSVTITKKYINSSTGAIEKTEPVKSTKIEEENTPATDCETSPKTTYTATFDSSVDPDINSEFTVTLDVAGDKLQHDWVFDKENAELSQDSNGRYLITIKKTCNNEIHKGTNPVSVTSDKVEVSTGPAIKCGEPTKIFYTATFDSSVDPCITKEFTVKIEKKGATLQHNWKYDTDNVTWSTAYTTATIKKICTNKEHGDQENAISVISSKVIPVPDPATKCGETGTVTYIATFDKVADSDITEAFEVKTTVIGQTREHSFTVESVSSNGTFENKPTTATLNLKCSNCGETTSITVEQNNIAVFESKENQKTYSFKGSIGTQSYTGYLTVYNHTTHNYTVNFNWIEVAYAAANTKVEATATCSVGSETVPVTDLTLTNKMVGTTIEYTASAKDPDGKIYYSYKNVDKDGVVREGRAGQVLSGDFAIFGLEEEYPYTGKKITPDFYVMDGDVVLAKGGDYSVKYTNNKNVGEATIEISGKGNYKDKNNVVKFKIYNPYQRAMEEGITLAAGVKSIAKIQGSFVYNGKAQYPATITVNLNTKPKSTLTLTHEGDGVYTNEGDATVVISVVNNVNKGTAVVAAVGGDGKVKTKTFSIKAAEISSAKVIEGLEAAYSSKGAIPEGLEVTWKDGDEKEVVLIPMQDFTVKYSNNKAVGTGKIKLTGKGNFKGKLESSFAIKALDTYEIAAIEAFDKVKAGKLKVTVLDKQGYKVPDKKLSVTVLNEEGTAIDGKTKLTAGTKITVVVKSADSANVVIPEDGISKDAVVGTKMGSVKVDAKKLTKTYTGEAIELTEEDMGSVIVTYKKTPLVYGEDFVIVGYANNVDKGSMTVTIAGTGEDNGRGVFSSTKTFKVKIVPKSFQ